MTYPNPWVFDREIFTPDMVGDWFGFVYLITNKVTNKKYIGRKYFYSTTKKKVAGKKNRVITRKQSDWQKYYGSSKTLLADIELHGKENFSREILSLHESRGDVNYHELRQQVLSNVLESMDYYNDNIMLRYYRRVKDYKSSFKSVV
jgi:hypothetical protein